MDRRDFVRIGVAASAFVGTAGTASAVTPKPRPRAESDILEAGVREQSAAMAAGKVAGPGAGSDIS